MRRLSNLGPRALWRAWHSVALLLALSCSRPVPEPSKSIGRFGPRDVRGASPALLGPKASDASLLFMDAGTAGDRVSGLLEIPEASCAIVIARGGASVQDLDLAAYGEDGSVVGIDEAPDKTPTLTICPPHPRRIWISARIAAGYGLVAVGAERVSPRDLARAQAHLSSNAGAAAGGTSGSRIDKLEQRLQEHRNQLGGSWQEIRRVAIPLDVHTAARVSARIEADHCVDAFVLPGPQVGSLQLSAVDPSGAILGRGNHSGRERYIVACSASETPITFEARPQFGRGLGTLVLSKTLAGSEEELSPVVTRVEVFTRAPLSEALKESEATLAESGYRPGRPVATGTLEVSRRTNSSVALSQGCSRLDVVVGSPLRGIAASVWSDSGSLIAQDRSSGNLPLFVCGPAGSVRLELEATLRSGPYRVLLRQEAGTHAALVAWPLAASRLLSSLLERGIVRRASEVGLVTPLDLSPTELSRIDVTVPFGRCVDLTLALGAETSGAEIRLISAITGQEIDFSSGPHLARARVCSLDADGSRDHLKTRAELRVSAGRGKALLATRLLSPSR